MARLRSTSPRNMRDRWSAVLLPWTSGQGDIRPRRRPQVLLTPLASEPPAGLLPPRPSRLETPTGQPLIYLARAGTPRRDRLLGKRRLLLRDQSRPIALRNWGLDTTVLPQTPSNLEPLALIQSISAQSSEQAFHGMIRSTFGTRIPQFRHRRSSPAVYPRSSSRRSQSAFPLLARSCSDS